AGVHSEIRDEQRAVKAELARKFAEAVKRAQSEDQARPCVKIERLHIAQSAAFFSARWTSHAINRPPSNQPMAASSPAATVNDPGKRYQFQYGALISSHANTPMSITITPRMASEATVTEMMSAAINPPRMLKSACLINCPGDITFVPVG